MLFDLNRHLRRIVHVWVNRLTVSEQEMAQSLALISLATLGFLSLALVVRLITGYAIPTALAMGWILSATLYGLSRTSWYMVGVIAAWIASYGVAVVTILIEQSTPSLTLLVVPLFLFTLFYRGRYNALAAVVMLGTAVFMVMAVPGEWDGSGLVLFVLYVASVTIGLLSHTVQRTVHALTEADLLYRPLFEQSIDAVLLLDKNGNRIRVNQRTIELLGEGPTGNPDTLTYRNTVKLDEQQHSEHIIQRLLNGEKVPLYERTFRPQGGPPIYTEVNAALVYDQHGTPHHIQSIVRDITERKRIEAALHTSEERLRTIVDTIPVMICLFDDDGRIRFTNVHWDRVLGWTSSDLEGLDDPLSVFFPDEDGQQPAGSRMKDARAGWTDFDVYTRHGDVLTIAWTHIRLTDGRSLGIGHDVTEQRQIEQRKLALALEIERRALLESFIQTAAHEFRTPLATINSSAYLMSRSEDPDRRAQWEDQVGAQIKRITRLVDSLLLMTQLESDGVLTKASVDVEVVLRAICAKVIDECPKRHDLTVEIQPDLPFVKGDVDYLSDALQHIMDNACRFMAANGKIEVKAVKAEEEIWIEIHDNGAGIPQEALPHIFETFWRQDRAHSTPGFGLGLPIAQRIIEQHGGKIMVTSEEGQGTIVRVSLPVEHTG